MNLTKNVKTWIWVCGILLALILYDLALGWWTSFPPKRPSTVLPEAIFVFAPFKGDIVPLPKKGDWLDCWLDREHNVNRCRMLDIDGSLEYEGVFLPSEGSAPVSASDLQIDGRITPNRLAWVYFREQAIPIIKLRNGIMLLPAEAYDQGKKKEKEWLSNTRGQGH